MSIHIVSPGVHQSFGGPTKTIGAFQKALRADLYSCCESSRLEKDPLGIDSAQAVPVSQLPIFRQLGWVAEKDRRAVEDKIASSDLISCHLFYRYHNLWVREISRRYGVPYWFVPHGVLDPWVMSYGRMVKKAFWALGGRQFLESASTVIFSTKAERDKADAQFDLPASEVLSWPVQTVGIDGRDRLRGSVRAKLNIPEDARVLLYFGRLHPMKRPLETIEAVAKINDSKVHLIIVGNEFGVGEGDCMQLAQALGCHHRVHFVGPVYGEKKYAYLHAADCYISLSHRENFNHTAAESLAAGLPVILSPGNDLGYELVDAGCAWHLKDDNKWTAFHAIEEFVALPEVELKQMGDAGRNWVEANLSFSLFEARLKTIAEKYKRSV